MIAYFILLAFFFAFSHLLREQSAHRCRDVVGRLGKFDNLQFKTGLFPTGNTVTGRIQCVAAASCPSHGQTYTLPFYYCPSNFIVHRVREAEDLINRLCVPDWVPALVARSVEADDAGVPAVVRAADILPSVRLVKSATGERRAVVSHRFTIQSEMTSDEWMPLKLTGLPDTVLIFANRQTFAIRSAINPPEVQGRQLWESMVGRLQITETRFNETGRYFVNLMTLPVAQASYKVVYIGELIETDVCSVCLESRAEADNAHQECGHWFHEHCIAEWKRAQRHAALCPLCRMPVTP